MGLDPGIRTGVKVAVVDGTGKVLATTTVYPFPPRNDVRGTQAELAALIRLHKVELIAIGNGTGSRETEKLVADMLADMLRRRAEADQGHRQRGRRLGLFGLGSWPRRNSPTSTCRCAARCRSRGACRTRWPNWSRSSRSRSASASTSTMSTSIGSAARWKPWSRTR